MKSIIYNKKYVFISKDLLDNYYNTLGRFNKIDIERTLDNFNKNKYSFIEDTPISFIINKDTLDIYYIPLNRIDFTKLSNYEYFDFLRYLEEIKVLRKFIIMQNKYYNIAYKEIENGRKETHWIWYIFPQIDGLGYSENSKIYSIKNIEEAKMYIENTYLYNNLINILNCLLNINKPIEDILGSVDATKLRSCITLFMSVSDNPVFSKVLEKFYNKEEDEMTLKLINNNK